MSFTFQPKTDEEIQQMGLLSEGTYRFTIRNAEEAVSKSNNSMIKLTLEVYGHDGGSTFIYDYLVAIDNMAWKIKHFCSTINMLDDYRMGSLAASSLIRKEGYAQVTIEKNGEYPAKNKIKDYGRKDSASSKDDTPSLLTEESLADDDIDF